MTHGRSWQVTELTSVTPTDLDDLLALRQACHAVDQPDTPPPAPPEESAKGRYVVRDAAGTIIGELSLHLAEPGRRNHATMTLKVHPQHRRQGVGSALLAEAVRQAEESQQVALMTIVHAQWPGGPPRSAAGTTFAEANGFEVGNVEVHSRASLVAVAAEDGLQEAALAASQDFATTCWAERIPEDLLEGVAALHSTFTTEAPMGQLRVQANTVTADQLRTEAETAIERGTFRCGVVAVHRPTGTVVGSTFIVVPAGATTADQLITLVSPDSRGHRLSMRLKIENLRQLRQRRPDVAWVSTENAESNTAMRRVNEQLGFTPIDYAIRYHRLFD